MGNSILITGATSGIGLATAMLFLEKDWQVFAGTRDVEKGKELQSFAESVQKKNNLTILEIDVTNDSSVQKAEKQIDHLDVLVNNAGFGLVGALEDMSTEELQKQFEVNFFGVHRITQAFLPFLKKVKGTLINISSMGGRTTFPFFAGYNSTKYAIESYTEGLWHELTPQGVKVYLVEPGLIQTDFYSRSMQFPKHMNMNHPVYKHLYAAYKDPGKLAFGNRSHPKVVAEKIWQLAMNRPNTFRHPVGKLARLAMFSRWLTPDWIYLPIIAKLRQ